MQLINIFALFEAVVDLYKFKNGTGGRGGGKDTSKSRVKPPEDDKFLQNSEPLVLLARQISEMGDRGERKGAPGSASELNFKLL